MNIKGNLFRQKEYDPRCQHKNVERKNNTKKDDMCRQIEMNIDCKTALIYRV